MLLREFGIDNLYSGKKWENAMGFKRPKDWKETNIYFIASLGIAILSELVNVISYKDGFKYTSG